MEEETHMSTTTRLVVVHNNDVCPADRVITALETIFGLSTASALTATVTIHKQGAASVGEFPSDVAETKLQELAAHMEDTGYPLVATVESADWTPSENDTNARPDDHRLDMLSDIAELVTSVEKEAGPGSIRIGFGADAAERMHPGEGELAIELRFTKGEDEQK
jgi:ATP-dependent Clp protease adaptor protein ClpS